MPKKPQSKEELLQDLQQHPNRGKIAGEYVADISTSELTVYIDGELYNQLIQIRGALGLTKSQLAQETVFAAFRYLKQLGQKPTITICPVVQGKSNFRGNVPKYLYDRVIQLGAVHGLDKRQVTYLGLHLFANNSLIQEEYSLFIANKAAKYNCLISEVEEALYGLSKALSRAERYKLAEVGDAEANAPKMNI